MEAASTVVGVSGGACFYNYMSPKELVDVCAHV